jgi:Flp pilus assembly protein TadG
MLLTNSTRIAFGRRRRAFCQRTARNDSGQSMVEFALLLPVFLALLLGAAELARLAYAAIEVANAARAGVQYGAQNRGTAADTAGMKSAATSDAANIGSLQATPSTFCTCSNGTSITCANTSACTARVFEYVQVDTSVTFDPLIHAPALPKTYTVTGKAVMRVVQ